MEENTSYKKYKVQIINKNEEEDYKLILRNEDDPTESKLSIILLQPLKATYILGFCLTSAEFAFLFMISNPFVQ